MDAPITAKGAAPSTTAVSYSGIHYTPTSAAGATEGLALAPIPFACSISKLAVRTTNAPGTGASWTFTLMVNGVATALECVITDANVVASDETHTVALAAGDTISIRNTPSTGTVPAAAGITSYYAETSGASAGQIFSTGANTQPSVSVASFLHFDNDVPTGSNNPIIGRVPTGGTFDAPYVHVNTGPGSSKSWTVTLVKNGVDTSVTATVTAAGVVAGTGSVTVAAGDQLYWRVNPSGTPGTTRMHISMRWTPTIDGEAITSYAGAGNLPVTGQSYGLVTGTSANTTAETGRAIHFDGAWTARKMYVDVFTDPGAGASWTFSMRSNGTNLAVSAVINGGTTSATDLVNTDAVVAGALASFGVMGAGGPTLSAPGMACVLYRNPGNAPNPVNAAAITLLGGGVLTGAGALRAAAPAMLLSGDGGMSGAGAIRASQPAVTLLGGSSMQGFGTILGARPYVHLLLPDDGVVVVVSDGVVDLSGSGAAFMTPPKGYATGLASLLSDPVPATPAAWTPNGAIGSYWSIAADPTSPTGSSIVFNDVPSAVQSDPFLYEAGKSSITTLFYGAQPGDTMTLRAYMKVNPAALATAFNRHGITMWYRRGTSYSTIRARPNVVDTWVQVVAQHTMESDVNAFFLRFYTSLDTTGGVTRFAGLELLRNGSPARGYVLGSGDVASTTNGLIAATPVTGLTVT